MIDIASGELLLTEPHVRIHKSLKKETLLSGLLYHKKRFHHKHGEWEQYTIGPCTVGRRTFLLTFTFRNELLETIGLRYSGLDEKSFDEETETKRKQLHEEWLVSLLGTPHETHIWGSQYVFPWGTVSSTYDPRSIQSEIFIRYKG